MEKMFPKGQIVRDFTQKKCPMEIKCYSHKLNKISLLDIVSLR